MKILGLIPARGGSKGVPNKNIRLLAGKPLLQYTTEVALRSTLLDTVCLSSDDDEIMALGEKLGVEVPFKRPNDLATDTSPMLPVMQHAVNFYEQQRKQTFDAVCLLQPTSPQRTVENLARAIQQFTTSKADSLISVIEVPNKYNPHWVFEGNKSGFLSISTGEKEIIHQRQLLPKAYIRNGAIYLTRVETLMKQNSIYGDRITYLEMDKTQYINIDTVEDWAVAEQKLGFKREIQKNSPQIN